MIKRHDKKKYWRLNLLKTVKKNELQNIQNFDIGRDYEQLSIYVL